MGEGGAGTTRRTGEPRGTGSDGAEGSGAVAGAAAVLTVGHSTHLFAEFVALLRDAGVSEIVDVRRLPGSRRFPWFDEGALRRRLPGEGIAYRRIAALGGRRSIQRDVPDAVNGFWRNRSFHNYADYALTPDFAEGLAELVGLAGAGRPAVMCSEAVWWRCHRRIIADHLLARGVPVAHLLPGGRIDAAEPTRGAVLSEGRAEYPAEVSASPA